MAFIARWLEQGVAGRSADATATARRLRAFTLNTALLASAVAAADGTIGNHGIAWIELAVATAFFTLHMWSTTGSDRRVRVAAHLFLSAGFLALVSIEIARVLATGTHSNTYWYAPLVPLAAAYLLGTRAAAQWTAAIVLTFVLQTMLIVATDFQLRPRSVTGKDAFEQVLLVLVALAIADASRRASDLHLASAHEERAAAQVATEEAIAYAIELVQTNRALDEARTTAEHANAAKRNFLANVSHEIRTPLHGVIGMTELLATTALTPEQADYLRTLRGSSNALLSLLNDVLDFSKIEAGRMQIECMEFPLGETIEDVTALFAEAAQSKGLELVCAIDPALPERVMGDPSRVRQVLSNLVSNAVKFTARGEVCVQVTIAATPNHVVFEVRDTGIGIPLESQGRLFELFEQVDVSTSRHFGGTGLGLAISRQLTELLGGSIDLQSEAGGGSRFRVELPLPAAVLLSKVPRSASLHGRRVLIVEPNAAQRGAVAAVLESAGVLVDDACDAIRALTALRAAAGRGEAFDLALVAVTLPDADAGDTARRLRAEGGVAVVLLTQAATPVAGVAADAVSLPWSVPKPVRRDLLLAACHDALGLSTKESAPARMAFSAPDLPLAPMRVLVAEDNAVNQRIATRFLERLGAEVVLAEDGAAAVECVRKDREGFDLVLMDCQMPRLDGYAATAQIRTLRDAAQLPIIAVSANVVQSDLERCLAAGMNDVLPKPYTIEQLRNAIARWMPPGPPAASGGVRAASRARQSRA